MTHSARQAGAKEASVTGILQGAQHIVSFPGRSQYTSGAGGASACGLAAFNCARVVLGREVHGCAGRELLEAMMEDKMMEVSALGLTATLVE
jgi:hypothetical protein